MNTSVPFSQKPIFWILLTGIFASGSYFSYHYFSKVFPIINLDIKMNRTEALQAAKELAEKFNWGPKSFQQTAMFDDDNETQNFIELEGGGKKAFAEILAEKYFSSYTWNVRHFKEGEINETQVKFTPEGKPYGFVEKLSENTQGAALTNEQALNIAQQEAKKYWDTDFSAYTLVDRSQETKPSERIDHTFTYERIGKKVGEAPYRLKLVVSGDKLTEYNLSIKVPESFKRRYEHMRSFNNTIAQIATIAFIILYIFGGCILGLFFLMRQRWLIWKFPIIWAGIISFLDFLNNLNSLPLYWMNYNTQLPKTVFLFQIFLGMFLHFIGYFGMFALIFTAAESLGRKAFPQHLQFWKLWSRNAATSWQVLGRTLGGYLILGYDFAFIIAFYYIAFRYFDWWTPSETLINPNVLSYYFPWLASISQALQAGFAEECLFRAIPLSCAALIGQKKGNKTAWLIIGMIVQALIFSAGHANYPAQPGYARLVELLVPSLVFGALYLIYGLLPAIISHFVYDVVWMALPLFVSTAPGIWIDKVMVILASAIPLFIVLNARFFSGTWKEISTQFYNYNWQPPTSPEKKRLFSPEPYKISLSKNRIYGITSAGFLGLAFWLFGTRFNQDASVINFSKQEALKIAKNKLIEENIILNKKWEVLPYIEGQLQDADRFVWQIGGKNLYDQLRSTYVKTPGWKIRYAQFENPDIIERAEEYALYASPSGSINRLEHQLPESRTGKILSEQEARVLAHEVLRKKYNLDPKALVEISAISSKHPERLDWLFTFKDPQYFADKQKTTEQGQARISIEIAGDQITDYDQHIFVPEEWIKEDQQKQALHKILMLLCSMFLLVFLAFAATRASLLWIHQNFDQKTFFIFFSILISKSLIQLLNIWSTLPATFKTSEPFSHQVLTILSTLSIQIIFKATAYGLLAGFISRAHFKHFAAIGISMRIPLGFSIGALFAGIDALSTKFTPSFRPLWAEYTHATAFFPALSCILTTFTNFITNTILFYVIIWTLDYIITTETKKAQFLKFLFLISIGLAVEGATEIQHILSWVIGGCFMGLLLFVLYENILKFSRSLIPLIVGSFTILQAIQQAIFNAYPGALTGNIVSCLIIALFALWWSNQLELEN
jgi:hypothetical protein